MVYFASKQAIKTRDSNSENNTHKNIYTPQQKQQKKKETKKI
jgi:hypothetical protein